MEKKTVNIYLTFFLLVIIPSFLVHYFDLTLLPHGEHNWAQSDHYALALGFLENNFDFFHPKTFTLNHQFPPNIPLQNPEGITAVDFPILHFVVAIFMKLFGTESPLVFRATSLVYSYISLFIFFRTVTKNKNIWWGMLVTSFILFQPIYFYYQSGFHVSIVAFNTFLIALSFIIMYEKNNSEKYIILSFIFLTLAALIRFTHIILLIAFLLIFILEYISKKNKPQRILYPIISITIVISYFLYNKYLQLNYGSVFLNKPILADTFSELLMNLVSLTRNYAIRFLPFFHALVLFFLIFYFFKNKKKTSTKINYGGFIIIYFLGIISYTLLMSWSLQAHNYYALETWLPLLTSIIVFIVFHTKAHQNFSKKQLLFLAFFLLASYSYTTYLQYRNYSRYTFVDNLIENFKTSKTLIDKTIPINKPPLIVCSGGYNTPLISIKRNAYRINGDLGCKTPENMELKNYEFIIFYIPEYKDNPIEKINVLQKNFSLVAKNQFIYIWKKNKQ